MGKVGNSLTVKMVIRSAALAARAPGLFGISGSRTGYLRDLKTCVNIGLQIAVYQVPFLSASKPLTY
jgi:hypothetical protein